MRFLSDLGSTTEQLMALSKANINLVLAIMGILVAIHIVNWLLKYRLNLLGIHPRQPIGIPGIVASPWLHGDFSHLFYNLVPLFFLVSFMLLYGKSNFYTLSIYIILISGSLTWLFGRRAIHVGASSVIMGYFGCLLARAYQHPSMLTILIAVLMLFYLGGLFASLLPGEKGVSWEGHLFGFAAGIAVILLDV